MNAKYKKNSLIPWFFLLSGSLALTLFSGSTQADLLRPRVDTSSRHDTSQSLLQMAQEKVPIVMVRPDLKIGSPAIESIANKPIPTRQGLPPPIPSPDPVIDAAVTALPPGPMLLQFDFPGISSQDNFNLLGYRVLPPDTNGDVGPNHYVQWVNLALQIWDLDRSTNTATPIATLSGSPVPGNVIWSGFGGPCETTNDGDPIVLYDSIANRWMISQFAIPGPYYQCVAVSVTPDPTGPWHRYEFKISDTVLNDYGKFGVWPDGYYMAINQFEDIPPSGWSWAGQGVVVFERDKMLSGLPASMVYFNLGASYPLLGGMLPSDLDGSIVPPKGAPNVFAEIDDDTWPGITHDSIQYWNFHVDWSNPGQSTFIKGGVLDVASFDSNMCAGSRDCVDQPGTSNGLDAISDRLMYRLQYRNFGTHESLVVNHTVDVNGADQAAVRWYELRRTGGNTWQIHQQSTYSPNYPTDAASRWMGSAAMNGGGQIGLGYSLSSSSIYPSIAFTGRQPDDTLGAMTQGENILMAGSGVQLSTSHRWGDYSSMSVDPVNDCTFWYTNEYYDTDTGSPSSPANWKTHIGSFSLPDCSSQTFKDTPSTNWAYDYINAIFGYGISYGCGNDNFCPSDNVNREQMATFIVRAVAGEYPTSYCGGVAPFNDIDPNSWACGYIKKAKEMGITNGCGDGNYCPLDDVPRDQMAVFLARAKSSTAPPACVTAPFNDVPASYWACSSIQYIKDQAISLGCGNGNYCPSDFVPREQMAAFLARAFVGMP